MERDLLLYFTVSGTENRLHENMKEILLVLCSSKEPLVKDYLFELSGKVTKRQGYIFILFEQRLVLLLNNMMSNLLYKEFINILHFVVSARQ